MGLHDLPGKLAGDGPPDGHARGVVAGQFVADADDDRGGLKDLPEAFGKRLANLGKNTEDIAKARIEIEAMRMMVLKAAKAMDVLGNVEARVWVSSVKAMVPVRVCAIIDDAIQMHGATGVSQWTPLADMYASQRTLRLADGPDEVHWFVVGRAELARWEADAADYDPKADALARQELAANAS